MSAVDKGTELAARAVAPWEGTEPLAMAIDALSQISAELSVLRAALCEGSDEEGPLATHIVSRTITGIEERAIVAAEVAKRLSGREVQL